MVRLKALLITVIKVAVIYGIYKGLIILLPLNTVFNISVVLIIILLLILVFVLNETFEKIF